MGRGDQDDEERRKCSFHNSCRSGLWCFRLPTDYSPKCHPSI
ncbi:unnamed protein product [Linum tenue]|uniref:Uncharacterized protein n=1 Tax=Linum tenue TaxID=586396 RepID=A0AAV0RXC7_9ROSI|nr:unnamed protein product [Linum tenue]